MATFNTTQTGSALMRVLAFANDKGSESFIVIYRYFTYDSGATSFLMKYRMNSGGIQTVALPVNTYAVSCQIHKGYMVYTYRLMTGGVVTSRIVGIIDKNGARTEFNESDLGITDTSLIGGVPTERWKLLTAIGIHKAKK